MVKVPLNCNYPLNHLPICLFLGGTEYGYYAMQQAYINAVPFLGTVYFDASVVSYLRQQMYVTVGLLAYRLSYRIW